MTFKEWETWFYDELTNEERKAILDEMKAKRQQSHYYSDDSGKLIEKDGVTYIL